MGCSVKILNRLCSESFSFTPQTSLETFVNVNVQEMNDRKRKPSLITHLADLKRRDICRSMTDCSHA